jgi:hypothetical protein
MHHDKYIYATNEDLLNYVFDSVGPKGTIKKIIRFTARNANGTTYFNLGFGDLNIETGKIDDMVITDNKDRDKILATIASAVLDFTSLFPDIMVYAKGSTPVRTRLYQMGIAANFDEIQPLLDVYGFTGLAWQRFEKNINYDAFLVIRKKS